MWRDFYQEISHCKTLGEPELKKCSFVELNWYNKVWHQSIVWHGPGIIKRSLRLFAE